jgi:hypothetical protein
MSSDVMKKTYCHKIHQKLHNPGDPVWYYQYQRKVSLNPKLQRPWHGPFVAIERLNDVMYCILRLTETCRLLKPSGSVFTNIRLSLSWCTTFGWLLGLNLMQYITSFNLSIATKGPCQGLCNFGFRRNDRGYIRIWNYNERSLIYWNQTIMYMYCT